MRKNFIILILLVLGAFTTKALAQAVILKTDTINLDCNNTNTFLVPIKVDQFANVGSFQFTVMWNPANLAYQYTAPINPVFLGGIVNIGFDTSASNLAQGKLTFTWTKFGGLTLNNQTSVFSIAFKRTGGGFTPVMFVDSPVAVEFADADGNILNHQIVNGGVKPLDTTPPTISCPANLTLMSSFPPPVPGIAPTSLADNCAIVQTGWSATGATTFNAPNDPDASGHPFNFGVSTVTYKTTDAGGNTATCSFTVTVEPSTTSDTLTFIATPGSASCSGSTFVEITALNFDSLGSVQFSLGWNPALLQYASVSNFNPSLLLTPGNFGEAFTGTGFLSFNWTTNNLNGTSLPAGAVLFRINFNIVGGGSSNIQFGDFPAVREAYTSTTNPPSEIPAVYVNGVFNVSDTEAPVLVCPPNASATTVGAATSAQVNNLQPVTLTDNCGTPTLTYVRTGVTTGSGTGSADGAYNLGSTTVTYTAVDGAGNSSTCSFTVFVDSDLGVKLIIDTVSVDCQGNVTEICVPVTVDNFNNLLGVQFSVEWDETVLQFDTIKNAFPGLNLKPADFLGYASTPTGLLRFLGGNPVNGWPAIPDGDTMFAISFIVLNPNATSTINFVPPFDAVDGSFNSVPLITKNGVFSASADLTPPALTCPKDTVVNAVPSECSANIDLGLPTATDACGTVTNISSNYTGNIFAAGDTLVVFTATDNAGNSSSCSVKVTVNANVAPYFVNCPQNSTVNAPSDLCGAIAAWTPPTGQDGCGETTFTVSSNLMPGDTLELGPNLIQYNITDSGNLTGACSFVVTVVDTTAPVIICSADITVDAPDGCMAIVNFDTQALDFCDGDLDLGCNYDSGEQFPAGTTEVTCIAVDDFSNLGECSFKITVVDKSAPTFTNCPPNDTLPVSPNTCGAFPNWTPPAAIDACQPGTIPGVSTDAPGSFFGVGTKVVTYTATDNSGNTSTCTFSITVEENVPPTISNCPTLIVVELPANKCDSLINWPLPVTFDNCGLDTVIVSHTPGTKFKAGKTTVTYTAVDSSGNTAVCSFDVFVNDNVPPVFNSCPADITVASAGNCGGVPQWVFPTASDNCSIPVLDSLWMPGDTFPIGVTNVVIIAEDASENQDTCAFMVTVTGIPPGFTGVPANITVYGCAQAVNWTAPTPTGFCKLDSLVTTHAPGATFQPGAETVTYTAYGLPAKTSVTFTVTVLDTIFPAIGKCPEAPIVVNTGAAIISDPGEFIVDIDTVTGCASVWLDFDPLAATDDCGTPEVTQTEGGLAGSVFPIGLDTLTFLAVDAGGNQTVCKVIIEVQGLATALTAEANPPIACPGSVVTLNTDPIPGATFVWTNQQGQQVGSTNSISILNLDNSKTGTYSVSASINGCSAGPATVAVVMAQAPDAVDDLIFTIAPGATDTFDVVLNDVFNPAGDFFIKNAGQIPGLTNLNNGKFAYTAGADPGKVSFFYDVCSESCPDLCDMATVTIEILDTECKFVPNIITPDNDGINDRLEIPCIDAGYDRANYLVIYNQWGDKVFEASPYSNDPAQAWGGQWDGKDLPDGVYFYIFQPAPDKPVVKGFVEIFR